MVEELVRVGRSRAARHSIAAYALAAVLLWPIPLFNVLHVESCAVLAGVGFVIAGLSTLSMLRDRVPLRAAVAWQIGVLVVPLALMTVPMLWARNCQYTTGLLFFVVFPGVSVVLASSLAYLLHALGIRRPRLTLTVAAVLAAALPPIYDLALFPQLYTYNHVFGGVLGPIYDEHLAIRPGIFSFRALSLLWAATLYMAGRVAVAGVGLRHRTTAAALTVSLFVVAGYAGSATLGWNTTNETIQNALGSVLATDHFEVYYDGRSVVENEIEGIADELEFRYATLSSTLATQVDEPIRVYLYPTAEVKGRLTGSRSTSVAPVWLPRPQIHMLIRRVGRSLDHELVHVFSREFGLPVLRASPSIGLVEGLAAALEAPDGRPSTADLMEAVVQDGSRDSVEVVEGVARALDAFGFWTSRGAVSYAAAGSFVRYLIDVYGIESFKRVYRSAAFRREYGKTRLELAAEWYGAVRRAPPVSPAARPLAEAQFSVPSLFESECPHAVPEFLAAFRDGVDRLSLRDTLAAERAFVASLEQSPDYLPSAVQLASIRLSRGEPGGVQPLLARDTAALAYPQVLGLVADALAMDGRADSAQALYSRLENLAPAYAVEYRLMLWLRQRLAYEPSAIRWLVSGAEGSTAPSSIVRDEARSLHLATRSMRRSRHVAACTALTGWPLEFASVFPPGDRALFTAQTRLWIAEACLASGYEPAAIAAGEEAARTFSEAGERDLAEYAADRVRFAQWKLSKTAARKSPQDS